MEIYNTNLYLTHELVYYVINLHGLHIFMGSLLWVKIYWYFVDGL